MRKWIVGFVLVVAVLFVIPQTRLYVALVFAGIKEKLMPASRVRAA